MSGTLYARYVPPKPTGITSAGKPPKSDLGKSQDIEEKGKKEKTSLKKPKDKDKKKKEKKRKLEETGPTNDTEEEEVRRSKRQEAVIAKFEKSTTRARILKEKETSKQPEISEEPKEPTPELHGSVY